jgi:hypothetical protein
MSKLGMQTSHCNIAAISNLHNGDAVFRIDPCENLIETGLWRGSIC